jgi:hypothetical protein
MIVLSLLVVWRKAAQLGYWAVFLMPAKKCKKYGKI